MIVGPTYTQSLAALVETYVFAWSQSGDISNITVLPAGGSDPRLKASHAFSRIDVSTAQLSDSSGQTERLLECIEYGFASCDEFSEWLRSVLNVRLALNDSVDEQCMRSAV